MGSEDDQTKSFIVALLRNYFLELSVDKIELMCSGYIDQLLDTTPRSNPSTGRAGPE
jgi:hypothetical protein